MSKIQFTMRDVLDNQAIEDAAYHEAGHVIAFLHLRPSDGPAMIEVSIDCTRPGAGLTELSGDVSGSMDFIASEIVVAAAGDATRAHRRGRRSYYVRGTDGATMALLVEATNPRSHAESNALLRWARLRASNIIATRWTAVEHLAQALLRRGALSGAEAVAIFDEHTRR